MEGENIAEEIRDTLLSRGVHHSYQYLREDKDFLTDNNITGKKEAGNMRWALATLLQSAPAQPLPRITLTNVDVRRS